MITKHHFILFSCLLFGILPVSKATLLKLCDGSELNVVIFDQSAENYINFKIPQSKDLLSLPFTSVLNASFNEEDKNTKLQSYSTRITFRNGDSLKCKLEAFDNNAASISTHFSDSPIVISREDIQSIHFNLGSASVITQFPENKKSDPNKWSELNSGWEMNAEGILYTTSHSILGKEVKNLPDSYQFQFTFSLESARPNMRLYLNADALHDSNRMPKNSICLNFTRNGLQPAQYRKSRYYALGTPDPTIFDKDNEKTTKITVYVNQKAKKIAIQIGDTKPKNYNLRYPMSGQNNFMLNASPINNSAFSIHHLAFLHWDGKLDFPEEKSDKILKTDILKDNKGNSLSGQFETFDPTSKTSVVFKPKFSTSISKLDSKDIESITFQSPTELKSYPEATHKLILRNKQSLSFHKVGFEKLHLNIHHPVLGIIPIDYSDLTSLSKK